MAFNLLFINYEYPPVGGGASNALYNIAKECHLSGHKSVVVTSSYLQHTGKKVEEGVLVYRIPALRQRADRSNMKEMSSYVLSALFHLPKIIRSENINQAIIFFSIPCGPLGLYLKKVFKIPYIISLRGGDIPGNEKALDKIHRFLAPLRKSVLKQALAVTSPSQGAAIQAQKVDDFPIKVIANGVDGQFFKPLTHFLENKDFTFLFVGRFSQQKNLFFTLDVLNAFFKKVQQPFKFQLVGGGPDEEKLRHYAQKLEIKNFVVFSKWCSKKTLLKYYQTADIFLNLSLYEGMPNTVLEALSCGTPAIVSNIEGNNDLILHQVNGYINNLNEKEAIVANIEHLYRQETLRFEMRNKARKIVEKEFSWKMVSQSYIQILEQG